MDLPAVHLLCLEQEDHSLLDHAQVFRSGSPDPLPELLPVYILLCLTQHHDKDQVVHGRSLREWEPSQPAAMHTAEQPEPTADSESEPKAKSDQVHELATVSVTEGILVEFAGMD